MNRPDPPSALDASKLTKKHFNILIIIMGDKSLLTGIELLELGKAQRSYYVPLLGCLTTGGNCGPVAPIACPLNEPYAACCLVVPITASLCSNQFLLFA